MRETNHRRADVFVLSFTGLLLLALIGMTINMPSVMFLATPLMVAVLLYMAISDSPSTEGRARARMIMHGFNLVSISFWVIALWGLGSDLTLWGLPVSTAVIGYFAWPFYTIVGGLVYAVISKMAGVAQLQEHYSTDTASS